MEKKTITNEEFQKLWNKLFGTPEVVANEEAHEEIHEEEEKHDDLLSVCQATEKKEDEQADPFCPNEQEEVVPIEDKEHPSNNWVLRCRVDIYTPKA